MTVSRFSMSRRAFMAGMSGLGFAAALAGSALAANPGDISDADAYKRQQAGEMIIVDIRTPPEWQQTGIAEGAIKLDMTAPDFVEKLVELRKANPDKEIGLMCRTSHRSSQAQQALIQAGFDRVYSIVGGIAGNGQTAGWIADGLPTVGCC